jgi:GNAT superfamily N-acetyltransferase
MDELKIEIIPSEDTQIEFLQSELSTQVSINNHQKRHAVQQSGKGLYLIAWQDSKPVGHFLLRWDGPETDTSGMYPYPTPYLEAGGTKKAYRRKGVATKLIKRAEEIIKEKNYNTIGLAVGTIDNPDAKRLYEKLGFMDWNKGVFEVSWEFKSSDGKTGTESETCIYMFKNL